MEDGREVDMCLRDDSEWYVDDGVMLGLSMEGQQEMEVRHCVREKNGKKKKKVLLSSGS